MGLLSLIGVGLSMAAIEGWANSKQKKAYPGLSYSKFDAECARNGIRCPLGFTKDQILKIAARNGVKPNKAGLLPENGWVECIYYVERYANSARDVESFKRAWRRTVENQIKEKQKVARNTVDPEYERIKRHIEANYDQNGPAIVLEYKHWHGMPKEEHLKRMNALYNDTFWGSLCKEKPILRDNPRMEGSHTEVWIMNGHVTDDQDSLSTKRKFKNNYKLCCKQLGYEDGF